MDALSLIKDGKRNKMQCDLENATDIYNRTWNTCNELQGRRQGERINF